MKQCDICLKETEEELYDLLEKYRTNHIKHVCYDCNKVLNFKLDEIKQLSYGLVKNWFIRYLEERRRKHL